MGVVKRRGVLDVEIQPNTFDGPNCITIILLVKHSLLSNTNVILILLCLSLHTKN